MLSRFLYGLSSFTMEALAKESSVRNPLIYKYFNTRLREQVTGAKDYRELVSLVMVTL